jgi:L-threonylcarbamoyladenylate synthase
MQITVDEACTILASGGVIAIPTDTVYGLAVDFKNPEAVKKLFALKNRPFSKPIVTLVADAEEAFKLSLTCPEGARQLSDRFWPGPLTIVLPVNSSSVIHQIRAEMTTAAFRVPKHPLTLELLKKYGPLAAPSANPHKKSPAVDRSQVEEYFGADFPVLDGGITESKVASTIVAYDQGQWCLYRQGSVSEEDLREVLMLSK